METQVLIQEFEQEVKREKREILGRLFEKYGEQLQTDIKGDYLFCSLNSEKVKDFTNLLNSMAKATTAASVPTVHFRCDEYCIHVHEVTKRGEEMTLDLQKHYFEDYEIDPGLQIDVSLKLMDVHSKFILGKRKLGHDMIYAVFSNASMATIALKRVPKERNPGLCPSFVRQPGPSPSLFSPGQDPSVFADSYSFYLLADRLMKKLTSFDKDLHGQNNHQCSIEFNKVSQMVTLTTGLKTLEDRKSCELFPEITVHGQPSFTKWKGTFNNLLLTSMCKLGPVVHMYLAQTSKHSLLKVRMYFKELALPRSDPSCFEVIFSDDLENSNPVYFIPKFALST